MKTGPSQLLGIISCIALVFSQPLFADDSKPIKAKIISEKTAHYPAIELKNNREGWVLLSVTVDSAGKVQNPLVIDSLGGKAFQKAALDAATTFIYKPEMLAGKSSSSSDNEIHFYFKQKHPSKEFSRAFKARYYRIRQRLKDNELEGLATYIAKTKDTFAKTLFEQAWLSSLEVSFYQQNGNASAYLDSLMRTIRIARGQQNESIMKETMLAELSAKLYMAQMEQGKIKAALDTVHFYQQRFSHLPDPYGLSLHSNKMLENLAHNNNIRSDANITERGHWWHKLLRNKFRLEAVQGQLNSLELRCDKQVQQLPTANIHTEWEFPKSWGDCFVNISGLNGSRFTLIESNI